MKKILGIATMCFLMFITLNIPVSAALCPDGSYVGGSQCNLCPDGSYSAGSCSLQPDGSYN